MSHVRRPLTDVRTVLLTLGLTLPLALGACSGDGDPAGGPSSSETASAHAQPYAVTLELVTEEGATTPSDLPPGATPPAPPPGPTLVEVTNTGARKDVYILRLLPPGVGGVVPESLELGAGESVVVQVSVAALAPDQELSLVAVSRGDGGELAELELPAE